MSKQTDTLIAVLAGVALGAAAGILFAPEKGEKTRGKLKNSFDDKKDDLKDKFEHLSEQLKSKFARSKVDLESSFDTLISKVDDNAEDIISTLEKKLDELKKTAASYKKIGQMAFEKIKENTDELQQHAKEYLDSNISYYKLWFFKVAMKSTTMLLKIFLLSMMLLMVVLFLSVAAALAIGYALNNFAYGFLIIGGFYLIISLLIYSIKDKIVEGPILEKFSEFFFND